MGSIPRSSRSRSPSPGPGTSRSNGVHYRGQGHSADTSLDDTEPQFASTSRHGYPPQQPVSQAPPGGDEYLDRTMPRVTSNPLDDSGEIKTPGGTLKRQVKFDWESIDPELLKHCRTTNPVLHENKYWV